MLCLYTHNFMLVSPTTVLLQRWNDSLFNGDSRDIQYKITWFSQDGASRMCINVSNSLDYWYFVWSISNLWFTHAR